MISQSRTEQIASIREGLDTLRRIAGSRAGASQAATLEYLEELRQKLDSENFYLAVLGLFKRGKSTLINALLQSDVLPVGVVPVTSVITLLNYSERPMATVALLNGETRDVAIQDLPEYVTERGNPGNAKGVKEVEVRLPSPLLKDGVTIIDTPGVGSTYLGGTQTTYRFLERVDACVFTLAVDPPIGQAELDLLKAITPHARRLVFVLNKKDYIDESGLNESISFCKEVMGSRLGLDSIAIHPISARWALEGYREDDADKIARSGMKEFVSILNELLHKEKEEILIASTAAKALRTAEDLYVSQEIAIRSAGMPLSQLEEAVKRIDGFLKVVDSRKQGTFYLLEGKSKEIVQTLDDDLEKFREEREPGFLADLESYADEVLESKTNSREATSALEERLRGALVGAYSDFIASEDQKIAARFDELVSTFSHQVDALVGDVRREVSALFGIELESPLPGLNLTSEHEFYYRSETLSPIGGMFVGELSILLPKLLLKGTLKKKFMGQAKEAFDGTGGRIRYDYFVVRLDKGIIDLKREVRRLLDSSILAAREAIEEGACIHQRSSQELGAALGELNSTLEEIQSVRDRLRALLPSSESRGYAPAPMRGGA